MGKLLKSAGIRMPKLNLRKMAGLGKMDLGVGSMVGKKRGTKLGSKAYFKRMLKDV